jgi:hypothetical protein
MDSGGYMKKIITASLMFMGICVFLFDAHSERSDSNSIVLFDSMSASYQGAYIESIKFLWLSFPQTSTLYLRIVDESKKLVEFDTALIDTLKPYVNVRKYGDKGFITRKSHTYSMVISVEKKTDTLFMVYAQLIYEATGSMSFISLIAEKNNSWEITRAESQVGISYAEQKHNPGIFPIDAPYDVYAYTIKEIFPHKSNKIIFLILVDDSGIEFSPNERLTQDVASHVTVKPYSELDTDCDGLLETIQISKNDMGIFSVEVTNTSQITGMSYLYFFNINRTPEGWHVVKKGSTHSIGYPNVKCLHEPDWVQERLSVP